MAYKNEILVNSNTGDIFEFIETSKSTNGINVVIKSKVFSKGMLVPNHFHLYQDETFQVLEGELTIWYNNKYQNISSENSITLPKNKAHNHYNSLNSPVTYLHSVSPALDFEHLIENLVGLAKDGKMVNGKAGLIQELVTLRYLDSKAFLSEIPIPVQKFLMNTISPIARIFGYRAIYSKYSGFEK